MSDDNLDINSPRGRNAAELQHIAANIVFGHADGWGFVHTPDNEAAAIDGFILRDGVAVGFAEIKSRDSTYDNMMGSFSGEWLLTHQKLLDIQKLSSLLRMPGYGLVYLIPSKVVLSVKLTNSAGDIVCNPRIARTETRATVNGGTANRINAFISVKEANVYRQ